MPLSISTISVSVLPSKATIRVWYNSPLMSTRRNMMGMALRALEFCLHCLDASPWPFLLEEVLHNYALAVEACLDEPVTMVV